MASVVPLSSQAQPLPVRLPRPLGVAGGVVFALIAVAVGRHAMGGGVPWPTEHGMWLAIHLASVVPALPLGAFVLLARKGTPAHHRLGRLWAVLMLVGAGSSFGLTGLMGHWSPIHLLSVLTLLGVPWGVWNAMRGRIGRHQRTMLRVYIGLVAAGLFAFVPGRLLGLWLFG